MNDKLKWSSVSIDCYSDEHIDEMYAWIKENIVGYNKHVVIDMTYQTTHVTMRVKFRHEKDLLWFKLVWQ